MSPEIEYVNPPDAVEPGVRTGPKSFALVRDVYPEISIDPIEFHDAGDDVVVIADVSGRGRESGMEVANRQGHVWTIDDGLAVRFQWYSDPDDALEAAGLPRRGAG